MFQRKPLPVLLVILLDLLGIGAMLGIFALFLFMPQDSNGQPLQNIVSGSSSAPAELTASPEASETQDPAASSDAYATPEPAATPVPGDFSATFPTDEPAEGDGVIGNYADDDLRVVVTERHSGDATYYVAEVWVRNIRGFKTAFAQGKYGHGLYEMPSDIAIDQNAIVAISGDTYGSNKQSVVIRNGNLYRDSVGAEDVCILYADGVMESYYASDFNLDAAVARGAYQGWAFGPKLIDDGKIPASYNTTDVIIAHNPRSAIGYFEPGHYCLVVVDGRQGDYSKGMTMDELSQTMIDLGCVDAYNLDGGQSAMMIFQNQVVNQPYKGGRAISDIIYFGGSDPQ
ncbi:MAG: phosphodiester glycosidase family protein [Eubacteriales bacterium]|nr:phosphodiester glycosidase family protein [Eubacteriales bacterium]